ncbi:nol1 nop2 sun family protein [Nannochloropsis oceanica]
MGKSWHRKKQKRDKHNPGGHGKDRQGGGKRGNEWIVARDPTTGKNIVPGSPVFEAYYQAQGIVASEVEWQTFMQTLAVPLPASFRVNLDCDFTDMLVSEIEGHVAKRVQVDGEEVAPIKRLEFFQGGHAYQMAIDRHTLRKDTSLGKFHELIKVHTDAGTITRQETVSMIPPVVLGVQPHHRVLDMCAAPGSKTSQMLETLSRGCSRTGQEPSGYIIANDSDTARAYMLVHQCRRINTVALCVTTHKAQLFPARGLGGAENTPEMEAEAANWKVPRVALGYFDRILCDVPCSGDGTVRKTFNIWRTWSPGQGLGLHPMQFMIAQRGAALLKIGGLMVYSTCTLNPIENEAVVLSLLKESEGALELLDPRPLLPGLKVRPGLDSWKVIESTTRLQGSGYLVPSRGEAECENDPVEETLRKAGLTVFPTYETVPEPYRRWIKPSCFPPQDPELSSRLNLHYCMRCLPHDQDTGGFFIALLKKTRPMPKPRTGKSSVGAEAEVLVEDDDEDGEKEGSRKMAPTTSGVGTAMPTLSEGSIASTGDSSIQVEGAVATTTEASTGETPAPLVAAPQVRMRQNPPRKAFVPKEFFVPLGDEGWATIQSFYGVSKDFPRDRLFLRKDGCKVVILLSKGLLDDVQLSTRCQLQLVNAGTRIFDRASAERSACTYRLSQDGMAYMLPHMSKRVVKVGPVELAAMTVHGYLDLELLPLEKRPAVEELEMGSFVATLEATCLAGVAERMEAGIASFALMCWRGFGTKMNVMCIAHDLFIFQCRLKAAGLITEDQLEAMRKEKRPPREQPKQGKVEAESEAAAVDLEGGDPEAVVKDEGMNIKPAMPVKDEDAMARDA